MWRRNSTLLFLYSNNFTETPTTEKRYIDYEIIFVFFMCDMRRGWGFPPRKENMIRYQLIYYDRQCELWNIIACHKNKTYHFSTLDAWFEKTLSGNTDATCYTCIAIHGHPLFRMTKKKRGRKTTNIYPIVITIFPPSPLSRTFQFAHIKSKRSKCSIRFLFISHTAIYNKHIFFSRLNSPISRYILSF